MIEKFGYRIKGTIFLIIGILFSLLPIIYFVCQSFISNLLEISVVFETSTLFYSLIFALWIAVIRFCIIMPAAWFFARHTQNRFLICFLCVFPVLFPFEFYFVALIQQLKNTFFFMGDEVTIIFLSLPMAFNSLCFYGSFLVLRRYPEVLVETAKVEGIPSWEFVFRFVIPHSKVELLGIWLGSFLLTWNCSFWSYIVGSLDGKYSFNSLIIYSFLNENDERWIQFGFVGCLLTIIFWSFCRHWIRKVLALIIPREI
ncbi:MAG: hypothetical protein CMP10_00855 [Zetaproteobacteria bacterium]|nr:hypothetical protein [Pseudobdellovibrionaceae bacterium]